MDVKLYLNLRPLDHKYKLKEDYFSIKRNPDGPEEIVIHDPLKRSKDQF